MTERSGTVAISERSLAAIRPYRPADHGAGRRLWAEYAQEHRALYGSSEAGGPDAGAAAEPGADPAGPEAGAEFEEYLARLDLSGMWVADRADEGVVGLVGLLLDGRTGRVEPLVVTARRRGQGIGRMLLQHVAREARARGMTALTGSPESRNTAAIRCLHAAGYDALSAVQLTIDLTRRPYDWQDGLEFQNLRFRY
ncbi:MAG TPA: GNAT family N-acetyltransferase [Pilimelia sp.]|nr:GNAT family N-acetyltransferase [Pilimelia sp.]